MLLPEEPSLQPRVQFSEVEQHFPDDKIEASCHTAMGGKPEPHSSLAGGSRVLKRKGSGYPPPQVPALSANSSMTEATSGLGTLGGAQPAVGTSWLCSEWMEQAHRPLPHIQCTE